MTLCYPSIQQQTPAPFWSRLTSTRAVTASAPATCGELAQGYLDGRDFLINSPIAWFSTVTLRLTETPDVAVEAEGPTTKIARAIRLTLDHFGARRYGASAQLRHRVPRGKGLASSTSELTAAIAATAAALDRSVSTSVCLRIVLAVDGSSDGVFLPGVTMFNHLSGELYAELGPPPPLAALIVDTGGSVDTHSFDRSRARAVATEQAGKLRQAVSEITEGFARGDGARIARGAMLSAEVNQAVLPKPLLEELRQATTEAGGLGVNCAHTGTVLGVLFDPTVTSPFPLWKRVSTLVSENQILGCWPFVGGHVNTSPLPLR
jgi:L-threonine kinase